MIAALIRIFGGSSQSVIRRLVAVNLLAALLEGAALAICLPVLTHLFARDAGAAGWWLIPLGVVVAANWAVYAASEHDGIHLAATLRRELFARMADKLIALPLGWFDQGAAGRVSALVTGSAQALNAVIATLKMVLESVIPPVIVIAVAEWPIAVAIAVSVAVLALLQKALDGPGKRADEAEVAATAEANSRLLEFFTAQQVLRASGGPDRGLGRLDEALNARRLSTRRQVRLAAAGINSGGLGVRIGYLLVLLTAVLVGTGTWSIGDGRVETVCASTVLGLWALQRFGDVPVGMLAVRASTGALTRIEELLSHPELPEPEDAGEERTAPGNAPAVELRDVRFGYRPGTTVLDGVSLSVPTGTTLALVGPSGAGKSTVGNLVARFFDVDEGSVLVGGTDVRRLPTAALMAKLAVVPQDVYLFDGTLEENVRVGRPDATQEQLDEAARLARVDSILDRLPDGWQTKVGSGGSKLSGGERQRVSIARALLKDAEIVILDEASSALDVANEVAIAEALAHLGDGRTVIVIAHRRETIAAADQVAMIERGRVVETGTPDDLLRAGGRYTEFWEAQQQAEGWSLR